MPNILNKYSTILFDMDGVIVDSMPYHAIAWQQALKIHGLAVEKIDIYKREGMPGIKSVIEMYNEKNVTVPEDRELQAIQKTKLGIYHDYDEKIKVFDDVPEILAKIKSRNIKMGLVTGSKRESVNHILSEEIKAYFDVIISGDEVKHGKPHPEPYLLGIAGINSSVEETLVIENAPMGINSAKAAGLTCFAVETSLPEEYLANSDKVIKNHKELIRELQI
jgi:beta-phosphoglucomutase